MPKRTDIKTILIIGSGPIVIGQGCEFDYSGTQACKALREEGYQVVLVNSNPATIMTDPEFADRTYIEPITPQAVTKIIEREHGGQYHIDALLPTLGGQTALNCACKLFDDGVLAKWKVEMIGATREVIYRAEDRRQFNDVVEGIGLTTARHGIANTMQEAAEIVEELGLPAIIRPAFTLGGTGGGIAYNREEYDDIVRRGLDASMTSQVLIDQSLIGWKEYELEVMRDRDDNVVIICSIENIDAMGVHTGDSITVAPAQTLTDKEYQRMRDASLAIIRAIGVETGGSNIQFAINPANGDMVVVEMNPRVSRSSALASKATGFPIAKIAAKLAVGYTLWELPNDITGKTVACFEPTIDYVVTKIPRWTFEKFPEADETLTTQMKSVGEGMSIGRTFKESLQKGIRSMEVKRFGLGLDDQDDWLMTLGATVAWLEKEHPTALPALRKVAGSAGQPATPLEVASLMYHDASGEADPLSPDARRQFEVLLEGLGAGHGSVVHPAHESAGGGAHQLMDTTWPIPVEKLRRKLNVPSQGRLYYVRYAFKMGWSIEQVHDATHYDPWFLDQLKQLVDFERELLSVCVKQEILREFFERIASLYLDTSQASLALRGTLAQLTSEQVLAGTGALDAPLKSALTEEARATIDFYANWDGAPRLYKVIRQAKQLGYSDAQLAKLFLGEISSDAILTIRAYRKLHKIEPVYKLVDTCAAEFEAATPYYYSTYESPITMIDEQGRSSSITEDETRLSDKKKIIILGGGPNRIGQGIEFDYCCVQAAFAADELGYESVMVNSNPETVSTDYDTSDMLFFEPLTLEDVLNICERLNGAPFGDPAGKVHGVIVQFGGQTPLNLAHGLVKAGVPIIGTNVDSIDLAEDREHFAKLCHSLDVKQPDNGIALNIDQALTVARKIGYPVLVRPSFVLGGRAMEIVSDEAQLRQYFALALGASDLANQPILVDKFLSDAIECDVDVIADYSTNTERSQGDDSQCMALVCGVMEHIEEAGIHSGDSACVIPPFSLPASVVAQIKEQSRRIAEALKVRGLMNVQWAIKKRAVANDKDNDGEPTYDIFVLEVNPRASRTVPFVSKATGRPWARVAAKVMAGKQLTELGVTDELAPQHTSVKESVFPFSKFPGTDVILGPEMRSTGEVMGIDTSYPIAFAKSQMAAGMVLPTKGKVFLSVRDGDKPVVVDAARRLIAMGFEVISTGGTHRFLAGHGIETTPLKKISEGRPNCIDLIKNQELAMILNTPSHKGSATDEGRLRAMAVRFVVPMVTTASGMTAAVRAMEALRADDWEVRALQDYFPAAQPQGATVSS